MTNIAEKENNGVIRIAHLPDDVQAWVQKMNIDKDGDGALDAAEMGVVFKDYRGTKKDNKNLRYSVAGLVLVMILLVCCVFGSSMAAARLSKDTSVDPVSGIMYTKGSDSPIQTEPVAIHNKGVNINEMKANELDVLHEIILDNGSIKFHVKGYAKSLPKNQVALMVDGGSLIYGEEGLVAATGMAETMFNFVYPDDTVSVEEGVRRTLSEPAAMPAAETVSGVAPAAEAPWAPPAAEAPWAPPAAEAPWAPAAEAPVEPAAEPAAEAPVEPAAAAAAEPPAEPAQGS